MKTVGGLLKQLYSRQKYLSTTYLVILLLTTLLMTSVPMGIKYMLDSILIKGNSDLFFSFSIGIVVVFSISVLLNFLSVIINNRIMNNSNIFLRRKVLTKIEKARVDEIDTFGKGKLVQVIQKDLPVCQSVITTSIFQVIIQCLSFLVIVGFLFYLNIKLTLLLMIIIPLYFLIYTVFSKRAKHINKNFIIQKDYLTSSIQQIHSNYLIVKKYKSNSRFLKNYLSSIENIYDWYNRQGKLKGVVKLLNGGLQIFAFLSIFIYGGLLTLEGSLSVGAFVAYIMYLVTFFDPIDRLMSTTIDIKASFVSIQRVSELLSLQEEELIQEKGNHINDGNIILKDFDLKVKKKQLVQNLNVNIVPGKFNVLLGKNGVGKTTLIYYFARFYHAPGDNIFIDTVDINNYTIKHVREKTVVLFQKTQFISNLIMDHLETDGKASRQESMVTNFIQEKKKIFEGKTYIDELSGGQQQLLAFLHAMLSYPKILIIDEAFSSMDKNTKKESIRILRKLQSIITIIFVTHNDIDYTSEDNIIRLDVEDNYEHRLKATALHNIKS